MLKCQFSCEISLSEMAFIMVSTTFFLCKSVLTKHNSVFFFVVVVVVFFLIEKILHDESDKDFPYINSYLMTRV